MATGYSRGHKIYFNENKQTWNYIDTDEIINNNRPCKRCGRSPTPDGYDACLGYIEGATSACCGHGIHDPILIMNKEYSMDEKW